MGKPGSRSLSIAAQCLETILEALDLLRLKNPLKAPRLAHGSFTLFLQIEYLNLGRAHLSNHLLHLSLGIT